MAKKKSNKICIGQFQRFTVKAGSVIITAGKEWVVGTDVEFQNYYSTAVQLAVDDEPKPEIVFQFKPGDKVEIEGNPDTYKVFKILRNNVLVIERVCDRFKRTISAEHLIKCDPDKIEREKYLAIKKRQEEELNYLRKVLE